MDPSGLPYKALGP